MRRPGGATFLAIVFGWLGVATNVIISGTWYTGAGDASARDFGPGSVVFMPGNWKHVSGCRPGSDCVFYQDGKGKFDYHAASAESGR
jgi:hypothetical protein